MVHPRPLDVGIRHLKNVNQPFRPRHNLDESVFYEWYLKKNK